MYRKFKNAKKYEKQNLYILSDLEKNEPLPEKDFNKSPIALTLNFQPNI
jgi:hypothetical protein